MLLLFETPAGYSLFKVKDEDKLKDIDVRSFYLSISFLLVFASSVCFFYSSRAKERKESRGLFSRPAANSLGRKTRAINEKILSESARLKRLFVFFFECSIKKARANDRRDAPRSIAGFSLLRFARGFSVYSLKRNDRADDDFFIFSPPLFAHKHKHTGFGEIVLERGFGQEGCLDESVREV